MRHSSLFSVMLLVGFMLLGLGLINIYLLQPRLALQLEAPLPLPTIDEMPNPSHGEQVATTMSLIKSLASARPPLPPAKSHSSSRRLRNPFLESGAPAAKEEAGGGSGPQAVEVKESLPQVQMVMIGEFQHSALLDNVLVREGDLYKTLRIIRIVETGVYVRDGDKEFQLPLGIYSTASPSTGSRRSAAKSPADEETGDGSSPKPASAKERAALNELLHRLQPLLDQSGGQRDGNRKQKTDVNEGDGV